MQPSFDCLCSGACVKKKKKKTGPRGGDGNPLQYSCLGDPMDRGTGHKESDTAATEHRVLYSVVPYGLGASQVVLVVKNLPANAGDIRDSGSIPGSERAPEEGMATDSSILAWRIP